LLGFSHEEVEDQEEDSDSREDLEGIEAFSSLLDNEVANDKERMVNDSVDNTNETAMGLFELGEVWKGK